MKPLKKHFAVTGLLLVLAGSAIVAKAQAVTRPTTVTLADLVAQVKLLNDQLKQTIAAEARQQKSIDDLKASNDQLVAKLACVASTTGTRDFIFEGCNVHVRNGMGQTNTGNKYGNLILGYNKNEVATRIGSHNLVVGDLHEYLSYAGIVSGQGNTLAGPNATILSSSESSANAGSGAIIGANKAITDANSVIVGGTRGYTSPDAKFAVVIGGTENRSSGGNAVAVGGTLNEASGSNALTCGGSENRATANSATACGGSGNLSQGLDSVVGGGSHNSADARASVVSGGQGCSTGAASDYKWIVGMPGAPGCSSVSN